jgi:hypothetical protein
LRTERPVLPTDVDELIIDKLAEWSWLAQSGFTFQGVERSTLPDGASVRDFVFVARTLSRRIEFSMIVCAGPVFIYNQETGKGFTVEDWLVHNQNRIKDPNERDKYFGIKRSTKEDGLQPLLDFLEVLFDGPLKPILSGEAWENVPFDRFDYG